MVRESTLWLIDIVAIIAMIIAVPVHLYAFSTPISGIGIDKALDYEEISARGKSLIYMTVYILFLGGVLYHPLHRIRLMLLQYGSYGKLEQTITVLCILVGISVFVYALYVTLVLFEV